MARQLTGREWELIRPVLVEAKVSCYRDPRLRSIFDALLWVSENHVSWSQLPAIYPPYSTCYGAYYRWRESGVIQPIMTMFDIAAPVAQPAGRKPKHEANKRFEAAPA
ncbi:transposase [Caballeronia sp. LZ043]|uniref:transposase n=1 Tax=Caballeronia sp. LZ043 TaxID=3038569 RepID=UPI002866510A|nr:transposase [Caballeronia sp. LZ043]MDR5826063.1 transposase [Caballeronia sp. LZ043]